MKILVLVLLALPVAARAGDPMDPTPATTAAKRSSDGTEQRKAQRHDARRGAIKDARKDAPKDAAPKPGDASSKDEKPCEPVKPCPID